MSILHLFLIGASFVQLAYAQDFSVSESGRAHFGPDVAADSSGNFVVVWTEGGPPAGSGGSDPGLLIFGRRFAADGQVIGAAFQVNESALGSSDRVPKIAMRQNGEFIVVWHGAGTSGTVGDADVYGRRYTRDALPAGGTIRINDDSGSSAQIDARALFLPNGNLIVAWLDRREGPLFSYAQFFDSAGLRSSGNFRINTDGVEGIAEPGVFSDGRFFMWWAGNLQMYNAEGFAAGPIISTGLEGSPFALGTDTILVVWRPPPLLNSIYGRMISAGGLFLDEIVRIDDDSLMQTKYTIKIARSGDNRIVVVWQDHRNDAPAVVTDGDIYAQYYEQWGIRNGRNFKTNHEDAERVQRSPATVFSRSNVVTVWLEDQTPTPCPPPPSGLVGPGITNIMGTLQQFTAPLHGRVFGWKTKRLDCPPPLEFALSQNFPNPCNSETTISFDLPHDAIVDITLFDILGRKIRGLLHGVLSARQYHILVDVSGLSTGVYFCQLSSHQYSAIRRMMVVK